MSDGVVETIVRAEVFQHLLDQMGSIVDESILHIGSDGIRTRAVEPANVAMCEVDLDSAAFEHVPSGSFVAGMDLRKLDDYMGGASGDDLVSLAFDPETRQLKLKHTNKEFNVALINPDDMRSEPDFPEQEFNGEFTVHAGEFVDAVNTADLVSDHVALRSDPDAKRLTVRGEGDIDDVEVHFGPEEEVEFAGATDFPEAVKSLYSIDYLTSDLGLFSPIPNGVDVHCRFGEEWPIRADYEIPDAEGSEVQFWLAPRIQSE